MAGEARIAEAAAEAIRDLNHATLDPANVTAADVYKSLGALWTLIIRLPQALRQLEAAVTFNAGHDRLRVDDTCPPDIEVVIGDAVAAATGSLLEVQEALDVAHQVTSHIWFDHGDED